MKPTGTCLLVVSNVKVDWTLGWNSFLLHIVILQLDRGVWERMKLMSVVRIERKCGVTQSSNSHKHVDGVALVVLKVLASDNLDWTEKWFRFQFPNQLLKIICNWSQINLSLESGENVQFAVLHAVQYLIHTITWNYPQKHDFQNFLIFFHWHQCQSQWKNVLNFCIPTALSALPTVLCQCDHYISPQVHQE